jgi:hypothetical protein
MFRKIINILFPLILVGIIFLISYDTYQKTQVTTANPITIIPINASVIIQFNDLKNLGRSFRLSSICNKLKDVKQIEIIIRDIVEISKFYSKNQDTFFSNSLFVSFHKVSAKKSATLFSVSFNRKYFKQNKEIIALFSDDISTSKYDNQTIYFSESLNRYFSFKEDILFYSDNKMLLTDAIRTSNENTDNLFVNPFFSECYSTISNSADINLMINYNNLFALCNIFTNDQLKLSHFAEWTATDVKLKDNAILASGFSNFNSTSHNFIDIFYSQKNQIINILDVLPENTTQLFAISFNNQQNVYDKKNEILQNKNEFWNWDKNRKIIEDSSNVNYSEFVKEIDNEAGIFNTSSSLSLDHNYTYLKAKESIRASSMLQEMIISSSSYKDFSISRVIDDNIVSNLFGPLFKTNNSFFTTIDDYFIFGKSIVSLEYIIDNYLSNNILSKNKSFKNLSSYISNDASIFFYLNPGKTAETLKNSLVNAESFTYNTDSIAMFTAFSLQINSSSDKMLHNLCLFYDEDYRESIKEEWYYSLDTSSAISPQFVYNHFTKEMMILVQDNNNNLIALNTSGVVLWSKNIDNKVLGGINFIDTYENNKFQALFNTQDKLYLIDINGRFVDGFPKKLPYSTTTGHSLIDYDKNKNYRIIIVGDDNVLYNLDKSGKNVSGWKYTKTSNRINQAPKHFVVGGKDYILQATNNTTTKLLARNGTYRTTFDDIQSFTAPVKISEKGIIYSITSENKLWNAYVNGTTDVSELPMLNATSKILAFNDGYYLANENSVSYINDTKIEEIRFNLNAPVQTISLFSEYITITTSTSLYLIKDNKILEGFPIDSEGYFNILDIDNNGRANVVNIKNGIVYNYELSN